MGNQSSKKSNSTLGDKIPFLKGKEEVEPDSPYKKIGQSVQKACKCSLQTRLIGFIICCIIGWIVSFFTSIMFMITRNSTQFAIFYSVGQIIGITGSCFLTGFVKQTKQMVKKSRLVFTILYITSTIATILLGIFLPDNLKWIIFISMVVQIISYFFYTISFLPFGTKILKKIFQVALE